MSQNKGFTLVEVVIVLTVMALLSVAALPRIINIITQSKKGSRDHIVAAVRSGIHLAKISSVSETQPLGAYPFLDSGALGTCNTMGVQCFCAAMAESQCVMDGRWRKTASNTWAYDQGGSADSTFTYNMFNGTLLCTAGNC